MCGVPAGKSGRREVLRRVRSASCSRVPRLRDRAPPRAGLLLGVRHATRRPTSAATAGTAGSHIPRHLAERILTSKAALEGERKQVTVLFADLKGSTELLADRDPEEARKLLDPVLDRMMEAVHYYEGTVEPGHGRRDHGALRRAAGARGPRDARLLRGPADAGVGEAVFGGGLPVGRACRSTSASGSTPAKSSCGPSGTTCTWTTPAVGQTTHLAARMEQMALPGSILIPETMLGLTRDAVAVRSARPAVREGPRGPDRSLRGDRGEHDRLATAGRRPRETSPASSGGTPRWRRCIRPSSAPPRGTARWWRSPPSRAWASRG